MTTNQTPGSAAARRLHDPTRRGFGSDNHAAVHPEVMAAIQSADGGHQPAYGDDVYTARLREVVREIFGRPAEVFPVFNGTGANVVALQALTSRWDGVICSEGAHIHVDECGAPEKVAGLKLLPVPAPDGRLTPELIDRQARGFGDPHHVQPAVVSITQSSELGTVYSPADLSDLVQHARSLGMATHMDGARLSNAAAALGCDLRALTTEVGIDVLSLGGTKNGLLMGEAVVVLDPDRLPNRAALPFLRKSSMQLASKMRYVSAQLIALLDGDLWLRNGAHANAMATKLANQVRDLGVEVVHPVEANGVFARLPPGALAPLLEEFTFYPWDETQNLVRWMCSWDTSEADVAEFAAAIGRAVRATSTPDGISTRDL